MTRPIKVLLLLHELSPTGAPKLILSAFERFGDAVELRTLAYLGGPLEQRFRALGPLQILVGSRWPGIQNSAAGLGRFAWHQFVSVVKARLWAEPLRRWKPDMIYVNSVAGLLVARRLRLPNAPVLLHVHELDSVLHAFSRHSPRLLLELPIRYIAVSEAVREALTERYGIPDTKITVIPAFVSDVQGVSAARQDDRLVVGGAGVVDWVKGVQLWLLMAAQLKRLLPGRVRFVWVGITDDDAGWQFREMARKLHLADDITFVTFTPAPLAEYAQFDVFALTSWQDSFPLVVLENMLLETPVVCFAGSGGAREEVGDSGIVVPEFSPALMAEAIAKLAADPERRAALGKAARQRVLDRFTADRQVPKILDEIRQLTPEALH